MKHPRHFFNRLLGGLALLPCLMHAAPEIWDTFSDTWVATDGLGRSLPSQAQVGAPRKDKCVGIFYFLWLGRHGEAGPFDISKIRAADPQAMGKPDSPLWGPMHAPHHWGESIFGYYVSDDEAVIRKHAQMLTDAGVDMVIFDVTNGLTYPESYRALLHAFAEVRQNGGRTPQIAFLCPFGNPQAVVTDLWKNLYEPGLQPDLWFRWKGKPLILADPAYFQGDVEGIPKLTSPIPLTAGQVLGQSFSAAKPFHSVAGCFPTWQTSDAAVTLTLFRDGPAGKRIVSRRFENVGDNAWLTLDFDPPLAPGNYFLQASDSNKTIGWWSDPADTFASGRAFIDGQPADGDRTLKIALTGGPNENIRDFFTFRKPQPDYFQGPTQPDMWSWLEISPQHVFTNSSGENEMMSVGVAQNAVDHRLGSMSEANAKGRSFHDGAMDKSPDAVARGLNFAEQWERALKVDPQFIFITGWNEWIAGRFDDFGGVREPVMFVDQFDQEHSRDVEPMKGGHGDNYYYQMVSAIRRYKGVRALPPVRSQPITVDGRFDDWREVSPEFRDNIGDPVRRDHAGWGKAGNYLNSTGRNDIVVAKVSADAENVYFYVRNHDPITPPTDPNWMLLYIDADQNPANGWLGYDFVVNRTSATAQQTFIEKHAGTGYLWDSPVPVKFRVVGKEMELAIPRTVLGVKSRPVNLDFKWADNLQQTGDWSDFTVNGDAAPNDRFNYRARIELPAGR
ncbi:MAG: hypothetical protein ABIS50_19265 [Luteolibacter sp.]|uniref:hypothetical protein n=1 Tax=Luteolibacter sp. TaxID=1962973 RepID=UPI003265351A